MEEQKIQMVFLGMNEAGEEVYDWLNRREDVDVKAILTEKEQLDLITDLEPDLVVSSGFEHLVPKEILDVPEKGIVNLHPSFLPYNRGSHPYIWPIVENSPAGVSVHYMNEEIDQGDIIARKEVRVEPDDTAKELFDRLSFEMSELFKQEWEQIKQGEEGRQQNLERGSTHTKDDLEDLRRLDLDKEMKVRELIDLLRGLSFSSRDLAYFERNGERYYVSLNISSEGEE